MAKLSWSKVIKPPSLRPGDTIAIISPASAEKPERFDNAVSSLQTAGYKVIESANARSQVRYFAGEDQARADDFDRFLRDETISAIFASRGGYGCSRLLPLVQFKLCLKHPKIILGGSDITALLWAIQQKTGLVTFFGPMALQIGEGITDFSSHSLWNALRGDLRMPINFPPQYQPYPLRGGKAQGRLIGGCLSLVVSLLGTKFFGDISGKILFLEEIGEKPFRLDRMLTHLRNAGVFDRIAGLLLGDFHNCWTDDDSFTLPEMIEQILGHRKLPVLAGLPFGHSDDKMTLPLGIEIELDADKGEFNFLEKAVCCPGSEV